MKTSEDGEIAIASANGLLFCKYDPLLRQFQMQNEVLLVDQIVSSVKELQRGTFVCGVWAHPEVYLCQRGSTSFTKIACPSPEETQCTDIIKVPDFNMLSNPFVIMRSNKAINLVDLKELKMTQMVGCLNQRSSFEKMRLVMDIEGFSFRLIFSSKTGCVQEITVSRSFFVDLGLLAYE